jgi:hypothetical protein
MAGTVLFAPEPALERVFVFYVPGVSGFASALYFALITMERILAVLCSSSGDGASSHCPLPWHLGFSLRCMSS